MGTRATTSTSSQRPLTFLGPAGAVVVPAALTLLVAPYLGMLWQWAAPAPAYINLGGAIYLANQDTNAFIAADTWFLMLGLAAGIVAGALGYWRYRRRFLPMFALAAAGLGAELIARRVGVAFGPPPVAAATLGLADGATVHAMIALKATVVVLAWPVGVLLSYVCLIGGLERPPPRAAKRKGQDDAAGASAETTEIAWS